jgi:hypothetical protein
LSVKVSMLLEQLKIVPHWIAQVRRYSQHATIHPCYIVNKPLNLYSICSYDKISIPNNEV